MRVTGGFSLGLRSEDQEQRLFVDLQVGDCDWKILNKRWVPTTGKHAISFRLALGVQGC